jgi:phage-related protein
MAGNTSVRISNLGDAIFQLSVQMFNDLKPAIDVILNGVNNFIGNLKSAWEWAVRNKNELKEVGTYLLIAAGAWATYRAVLLTVVIAQKAQAMWNAIQYASINLLGEGMLTASAWTKIMAAAQWALNAAMTANPIGVIIVALAAVVAGIIYAYKHFSTFRAVLFAVWETVKEFGRIVSDVFVGLWHTIHGVFTLSPSEIKLGNAQMVDAMFNAGQRLGKAAKDGYAAGMIDFYAKYQDWQCGGADNRANYQCERIV